MDAQRANPAEDTRRYRRKFFVMAAVPLLLAMAALAALVAVQSRSAAEREIATLEAQLIAAKREELRNYVTQARNGVFHIYGRAAADDAMAQQRVQRILAAMNYGDEGFFFVYDYDGTNLVSPRQTGLINENWIDLRDSEGTAVVAEFIEAARSGSGYVEHLWPKPTTGDEARMVSYVIGFPDWRWAVGTGVFIDDILTNIAAARAEVQARTRQTFVYISAITAAALFLVFLSGLLINIRERSLADAALKKLTQRVIDTQEEERGRVARELHAGISQILVSARYALDLTARRINMGDVRAADSLDKGITSLTTAIQEVRRISRDLRPGTLDDLGLGPALKTLTEEFSERTGISAELETVVFRNRLDDDAKTAMFRVAQEALTNIERHAEASEVTLRLFGHKSGATLRISDNGKGIRLEAGAGGLGLRNMQERIEQLDGTLRVLSSEGGTVIEADVPLTHLLGPDQTSKESA